METIDMKFFTEISAFANSLRSQEEGATAVEYGLVVSLIAIAIIVGATALGGGLNTLFEDIAGALPTI